MPSFEIPDGPANVTLSGGGQAPFTGTALYAVTNRSARPVTGRIAAQATGATRSEWFTVKGEAERNFAAGESQTIEVAIRVPSDTPPGDHKFRLRVVAVNDPDNDHMESPVGTLTVPALQAVGGFPWWILIVAAAVLLLAGFLVTAFVWPGFLLSRSPDTGAGKPAPSVASAPLPAGDCQWYYASAAKEEPVRLMDGPPLYRLRFGDFNGDGKTDVFTAVAKGDGSFQWYLASGGATPFRPLGSGADVAALGFADFDGDGKTDIFSTAPADGDTFQWRFSSAGSDPTQDLKMGPALNQLAFGDFDGDGTADIFYAQPVAGGLHRWQFSSGGKRNFRTLRTGGPLSGLHFGDFDGDGTTDIFYSQPSDIYPAPVHAWYVVLKGTAEPVKTADGDQSSVLHFGDFNGDGKADTLATYPLGDGTYQWKYSASANSNYQDLGRGAGYADIAIGDFNGDGVADVFTAKCR